MWQISANPANQLTPELRTCLLKRIFVGNLPSDATEESVQALFSQYGKVRSIQLVSDIFSGKCRGFGFIGMEGHEARAAIAGLDGNLYCGKPLKVKFEESAGGRNSRRH
ncbi:MULTISPECIES: RNA recognition motif domain-containing protein [Methylobacter]|uniref:RNA recognition motif domain-containing protein n=1 Tax=Methylobacter TaxID=429 RepID=UPI0038B391BD